MQKAFGKYPDCKCVIVANLYGTPAKLDEIRDICDNYGAILIEDAAESLGATYKGRQTGTFGQYNAISFNGNKIITTSGGGMLLYHGRYPRGVARGHSEEGNHRSVPVLRTREGDLSRQRHQVPSETRCPFFALSRWKTRH